MIKPMCAVCRKPVDELRVHRDNFMCRDIWEARCHGQREVVSIDEETLMECKDLRMGEAFSSQTRRLPSPC